MHSAAPSSRDEALGADLDALRADIEAAIGPADLAHIERIARASRAFEIAGRLLIPLSPGPLSFAGGVVCLWIHKQLEATEIGHGVLHGAYDRVEGAERWSSRSFRWRTPIDEDAWRSLHNHRHHGNTNIAGADADLGHVFRARPGASAARVLLGLTKKAAPYYSREYLLYPALAGPLFAKVLVGNWLSELLRDVYSVVTIYCNHDGADIAYYPAGTRATSRSAWYRMQIEATNNFEIPYALSLLCGGLELHIEHHLFPRLPPNRLREIAPRVRAACEAHGVRYRTASWPRTLAKVGRELVAQLWRGRPASAPT